MTRVTVAFCALAFACAAQSQQFPIPGKPVRIIVPFPPGGQTDIQARAIAQKVNETPGLSVIVENKPGGSTVIGAREVQKAAPDGHTLFYTIATHVQIPHLFRPAPWDAFKDYTPITAGARSATVLTAHASAPFNDVKGLVAYAKANPGKLNFASFSPGSTSHLNGERFKRQAGIDIVHVPYKGGGQAIGDVVGGTIPLASLGLPPSVSHIKAGKLKAFAVTSKVRQKLLPDTPTFQEGGVPGFETVQWWGPAVPAGTPAPIVKRLFDEFNKALRNPVFVERVGAAGLESTPSASPEAFGEFIRAEIARWAPVVKRTGARVDN
jgi:tripartite-type tricarboxylate transporter receptor subunit TctC